MQCRLAPYNNAKISFPGFQEILDFTSAGSESSVSVTVNGDVDKEYVIYARPTATSVFALINNDGAVGNYGTQGLQNSGGSISAGRLTNDDFMFLFYSGGFAYLKTGIGITTGFQTNTTWDSGTTISLALLAGKSWNSSSNITSLDFVPDDATFSSGTRISVYARRTP